MIYLGTASLLCMTLFAANSVLCRIALLDYGMAPSQYTFIRGFSAAAMLGVLCLWRARCALKSGNIWQMAWREGSWPAACALFAYMALFSWAYVDMPTAAGTLIINACVQFGMVGWGIRQGLIPTWGQGAGLALALAGLVLLMLPGLSAPPLFSSLLMMGVGLAWSMYCICGSTASQALLATAGNFWRCALLALLVGAYGLTMHPLPPAPALIAALAAGAVATALGYALWYTLVPRFSLFAASVMQLSVPLITAVLASLLLQEAVTVRFLLCATLILGGIFVALRSRRRSH